MALVQTYLAQRRKRLVSRLMTYVEKEVYPHIDQPTREGLRAAVLAAAEEYHGSCVDLVKASVAEAGEASEEAVRAIARIEGRIRRRLG